MSPQPAHLLFGTLASAARALVGKILALTAFLMTSSTHVWQFLFMSAIAYFGVRVPFAIALSCPMCDASMFAMCHVWMFPPRCALSYAFGPRCFMPTLMSSDQTTSCHTVPEAFSSPMSSFQ